MLRCQVQFAVGLRHQTKRMDSRLRKVLIADDEPDILEILKYNLVNEGYQVFTAKDGDEALEKAKMAHPDLIVLDIMMPKKNGVEVCELLRLQPAFKNTLILFLTALSDESTQIKGLETGADDYISKPISPKVFISKVNSLFRRLQKGNASVLSIDGLTIDPEKFIIQYKGNDISLAKKEFELLYLLASKPGRVFLRHEILSQVWEPMLLLGTVPLTYISVRSGRNWGLIVSLL
jgi:two-component system, OmpR family, alkaline phosphatase synthesis response regulator PhoP